MLAQRAGIDLDKMLQVVGSGSGESAMRALKSGPMVEGDFEALFKLEHMLKDVRYCIAEARGARARSGRWRRPPSGATRRRDEAGLRRMRTSPP